MMTKQVLIFDSGVGGLSVFQEIIHKKQKDDIFNSLNGLYPDRFKAMHRVILTLSGKDYVSPDDVQKVLHDTLRHRIILSFTAEAQGLSSDDVISRLVELVPVP